MELWHRTMSRMLCTEALEGRWLLSVAAPSADAPQPIPDGAVRVIETDVQEEEDEGEEMDVEPSELPAAVVAALRARFADGVEIVEATFEEDDGSEYGVTARSGGQDYDVTLTPSGRILEVEQLVTLDELPQSVRDWLATEHPGAVVEEAAIILSGSEPTVELTFVEPGRQAVETTLAIETSVPVTPPADVERVPFSDAVIPETEVVASAGQPAAETAPAAPVAEDDEAHAAKEPEAAAASLPTSLVEADQARVAEALAALAAGLGAAAWVPEFADALSDVLPFDVARVEAELQQFLGELDSLTKQALTDTTPSGAALRLSIVVSLIAGVQLLLLDRRLRKGGPVVVFGAQARSWSWVLGTTMPLKVKVRRTNVFRG